MSDHVYKKIELVGSSPNSIEEAVANAIGPRQENDPQHAVVRGD